MSSLVAPILIAALGAAPVPAEFRVDFRGGQFDNDRLRLIGPGATDVISPGPQGLRMEVSDVLGAAEVGFAPKFRLRGDFEITASYVILNLPRPDAGYGTGPAIYIVSDSTSEDAATMARLHRRDEGHVYNAHFAGYVEADDGQSDRQQRVKLTATSAQAGRLRLKREADRLRWLVAEGDSTEFVELHEAAFSQDEITLVRVGLNRNGAKTPAAIIWTELAVTAEEFPGLPTIAEAAGSGHLWLWITALAAGVAAGVGGWYWRRSRL